MRNYRVNFISLCFLLCCSSLSYSQTIAAVGDLNGDLKPDVVVGNGTLRTVSVLLNDGTGHLTGAHFLPVSNNVQSVFLADLNHDGHLDILVTELGGPPEIMFGDGAGGFTAAAQLPLGTLVPSSDPAIADFNGDGFLDLAFGASDVAFLFGDGHGGFSAPHQVTIGLEGATIAHLYVTDANHDGKPDLFAVGGNVRLGGSPVCYVALNNGNGGFTTSNLEFAQLCKLAPDLNGDGNDDYLSQFTTYYGDGQGGTLFTLSRINSIKLADGIPVDYDHNGAVDFVQFDVQPMIQYFPGNGHGGFGDPITISTSTFRVIAVADLNGDGFPDLVLQDPLNPASISVFLNPGTTPVSVASASQTQISASAVTASTAAPVTLVASVGSLNAGSPQGAGSVAFTDGANSLGSAPVNIYGIAALDFSFASGVHSTVNGAYNGALDPATNTQFGASSSLTPAAVFVNPAAPSGAVPNITLSTSVTPARELNPVTFTATVTPSAPTVNTPSGNVVFRADGNVIGVAAIQGPPAQLTFTFPNPGLHNITATYGGDGNFPPATSSTLVEDIRAFTAARAASVTQLTVTPFTTPGIFVLNATLSGVSAPPSKFIYRVNGAFLARSPQNSPIQVFFTPPFQGTYTISAEYPGDAVLAPSTAISSLVVGNPGGDFALEVVPNSVVAVKDGQSATLTITLDPRNGFNAPTTFTCTSLPAASGCAFSPATLTPNGARISTTLTFTTTAPRAVTVAGMGRNFFGWSMLASGAFGLLLIGTRQSKTKAGRMARIPARLALLVLLAGCGGGGGTPPQTINGTPPGFSQMTIAATSSGVTHNLQVSLNVQ